MTESFQLAIESSAAQASVALQCRGELVFSAAVEAGRRQSEVLMGPLQEALAYVLRGVIEFVLVGTGPGSYNGARVGIAAGQGISLVHECPAIGVCSLEALATVRAGGSCLALGDARRETFFTLELREGRLSGTPDLLEHADFVQKVESAAEEGASLVTLEDPARLRLPGSLEVELAVPSAERLLAAWASKSEAEQAELAAIPPEPFYLRPPHITQAK